MVQRFLRHDERLVRPSKGLTRQRNLVRAERFPVDAARVRLVRAAVADDGTRNDEARTVALCLRFTQRRVNRCHVHSIYRPHHVPVVGAESSAHVFRERDIRIPLDGDVVVVVQVDELAEPQRPRE